MAESTKGEQFDSVEQSVDSIDVLGNGSNGHFSVVEVFQQTRHNNDPHAEPEEIPAPQSMGWAIDRKKHSPRFAGRDLCWHLTTDAILAPFKTADDAAAAADLAYRHHQEAAELAKTPVRQHKLKLFAAINMLPGDEKDRQVQAKIAGKHAQKWMRIKRALSKRLGKTASDADCIKSILEQIK